MSERTTSRSNRGDERSALEDLLRRYADEQLALAPEARERLRRHVLLEARRRAIGLTALDAEGTHRSGPARRRWLRRPAAALLAASLALAALAGVATASGPGGPLYGLRLWAETLTLPGDPQARAEAELGRLEARLSEASAAAEHGNGGAVRAALEAYRETVASALQAAGNDLDRADRLEIVLERHQIVLDTLAERLPAPAAEAVTQAIERNEATIEKLKGHGKPSPAPEPGATQSPPSPAPSAAPPSEEPGGPPSPKPGRTPPGQGRP